MPNLNAWRAWASEKTKKTLDKTREVIAEHPIKCVLSAMTLPVAIRSVLAFLEGAHFYAMSTGEIDPSPHHLQKMSHDSFVEADLELAGVLVVVAGITLDLVLSKRNDYQSLEAPTNSAAPQNV